MNKSTVQPEKIHKWDFKNVVRAGQSGIVYNFFMYGGKHSNGSIVGRDPKESKLSSFLR